MYLYDARNRVRRRLKSGNESSRYAEIDLDDGLFTVCNRFIQDTRCSKSSATIVITADTEAVDFSALSGFRPEMVVDLQVTKDSNYSDTDVQNGVDIMDVSEIRERKVTIGTAHGTPTMLGFTTHTAGILWPKPKATGTLTLRWTPPFTAWTPGQAQLTAVIAAGAVTGVTINSGGTYTTAPTLSFSGTTGTGATATATLTDGVITGIAVGAGGSGYTTVPAVIANGIDCSTVTLNIDDDLLEPLITFAAAIIPQLTEPEAVDKEFRGQLWAGLVASAKGRGSLGAKSHITRSNAAIRGGW